MKKTCMIVSRDGKGNSRARRVNDISEALRLYLDGHKSEAMHFAVGLCRDEELAGELLQEACYRALKAGRRYDASQPVKFWLYAILRNVLADSRRITSRRPCLSMDHRPAGTGDDLHESLAHGEEPIHARLEREETSAQVKAALSKLTRKEREVLRLREYLRLSYAEVARILRVPLGTVRSRSFRARATLRRLLLEYGLD